MDVHDAIRKRRSVRQYKEDVPDSCELMAVLTVGFPNEDDLVVDRNPLENFILS